MPTGKFLSLSDISSIMYKLAQLVKLLLGKQKRLSSSLRSHERKLGMEISVLWRQRHKASRGSLVS